MSAPRPDPALAARLEAARRPDEVVSRVTPMCLDRGRWWPDDASWPPTLTAGVLEPAAGYRFGPENVVLGRLVRGHGATRVVDLGAGSGSLLLIAGYLGARVEHSVAVERQPEVGARLRRTLVAHGHGLGHAPSVVVGDLREDTTLEDTRIALDGDADLLIANPPFFPPGWGRESKHADVHHSTHALHGDVGDFLTAARRLASAGATLWVVYDAQRVADVLAVSDSHGWRVRAMHWLPDRRAGRGQEPFRVWLELGQGGARSGWIR